MLIAADQAALGESTIAATREGREGPLVKIAGSVISLQDLAGGRHGQALRDGVPGMDLVRVLPRIVHLGQVST